MARSRLDALILDDGELQDVRSLLDELGALYRSNGEENAIQEVPLLITSLARARRIHETGQSVPKHALHLVVADAVAEDLGDALGGALCDFIVRRPVDAAVLALITRRAGYQGPERRRTLRVAMGTVVRVGVGNEARREDAILAQLSMTGCGLVTRKPFPQRNLRIDLPPDLASPRTSSLAGSIVNCCEVSTADGLVYDTSVVFDPVSLSDRVALRSLMAGQPVDFRPEGRPPLARGGEDRAQDRRGSPRLPYEHGALGSVAERRWTRVLIGRDISIAGMRVEREPDLALGDDIQLALYTDEHEEPVLVRAHVSRDDEDEGWFLSFDDDDDTRDQVEHLLGHLGELDEASERARVVSEVLGVT